MQRRAAAAYFMFFLVVSVAAYAYIGVAESQRPEVTLNANAELTNGSSFSVDGTTYTASNIHLSTGGGGGHGGGGGGSMVADLTWTNESSRFTATLDHNTTTTYQNQTYRVLTDNETSTLTLREEFNVSKLLSEDPNVQDSLATQNGTKYVVYDNGTIQPLSEWLPEAQTREFGVGDSYEYTTDSGPQQTTVASVSASGATLEWTGSKENSIELSEGGNMTLAGQQYFAHFPDHKTVKIISNEKYPAYEETLERQDYFHERMSGLWGVSILSGIAAVLILGLAYLPHRG